MEKEKLTFWEIIFEGLKKFAGEIIGALLLAVLLYCFPNLRSLITDYVFPKNDEAQTNIQQELEQHRKEEERLKEELRRKEEALREAEEARRKTELNRQHEASKATAQNSTPAQTPKRPAMSDKEFMKLCRSGTAAEVEEAIMNGANVNAKENGFYKTSLMEATYYGKADIAEVLLKHGADVNARSADSRGWTALMWAAIQGQAEVAEVLLKYGADINTKAAKDGYTALMFSVTRGIGTKKARMDTIKVLLNYGADVNIRNKNGQTALTLAKRYGRREWVNLLLSYGATE